MTAPSDTSPLAVTLTYDINDDRRLDPPRKVPVTVSRDLADVFARAAHVNPTNETALSFTSLLVGMSTGGDDVGRWLKDELKRQNVQLDKWARGHGRPYNPASLGSVDASSLPSELSVSQSARQAIEQAEQICEELGHSPGLEVRHLAAAYPVLRDWHEKDFQELGLDRLAWCRQYGTEMASRFPDERDYWRRYTDRAAPVPLTSFSADVYTERDLLGIDRTVDALALLIASTRTDTPLSIGVFGPWGSGKSFFMRHLRKRIFGLAAREEGRTAEWNRKRAEKTATPEDAPLYFGRVAQVEFNAWHYNEGNLVASLVDHIFRNLHIGPDADDAALQQRRSEVLGQIAAAQGEVARGASAIVETKREVETARGDLQRAKQEADSLRQDVSARTDELQRLGSAADAKVAAIDTAIARVREGMGAIDVESMIAVAFAPLGDSPVLKEARERGREIADSVASWQGFTSRLFSGQGLAVLALCAAVPLVAALSEKISALWAAVSGMVAAGAATMTHVVSFLRDKRRQFEQRLAELQAEQVRRLNARKAELKKDLDGRLAELRTAFDQQRNALVTAETSVAGATRALAERTSALEEKVKDQATAEARLQEAQAKLERLSGALLLDEFIKERSGTDEYRKQLGFLALVRRDFERLSSLISRANREWCDPSKSGAQPPISRIVLYIDDLDRCKVDTVVAVLEAVHLLLAFELFVCVLAVDPRWIAQCLREKHGQRFADPNARDDVRATVGDYLEKIFQIPIWMSPIEPGQRAAVVQSLLGKTAAPQGRRAAAGHGSRDGLPHDAAPAPTGPAADGFEQAVRKAEESPDPLGITKDEADFVKELGPLLSEKPRALKRFVNTYRLLKASLSEFARKDFVSEEASSSFRLCMTQLALVTAHPRLAPALVQALGQGGDETVTLSDWLATWKSKDKPRFEPLFKLVPGAGEVTVERFRHWLPETSRYLFHRID